MRYGMTQRRAPPLGWAMKDKRQDLLSVIAIVLIITGLVWFMFVRGVENRLEASINRLEDKTDPAQLPI